MLKKKTKKKTSKKVARKTWEDGNNPLGLNMSSPMSYESYMKTALEVMSNKFQVRVYKLAPAEDYPQFIRGKDLRIQIWFNKRYMGYEFLVEIPFWVQTNRNKEDRKYMREAANIHLKTIHEQVEQAKSRLNKTTKKTTKKTRKSNAKIGSTQKAFEDAKKK